MRDPLVLPMAGAAIGIVAGRWLTLSVAEAAWPIAAFGAMAIASRVPAIRWACICLAFVFAGATSDALHRPRPAPTIDAGSRETVLLEGCVVEPTVFSEGREQFTLELDPDARARVTLGLAPGDPASELAYGQRVEIQARIRPPHNYQNPGAFDYAAYLARQKIYWTATMTRGSQPKILAGRCGSRFLALVYALRTRALAGIDRLYSGDNRNSGLMEAILIGESSKLEKIWTENYRKTGTYHALVISGVHVTVLAGVLMMLLRLFLVAEIPALVMTTLAAWLYALVSGMSAPVVRAAGGFTLYLIARFFFRRGRVINLLAAVALVYILWDPGQLFDPSFQLSFLCVAAIGALAAPLLEATSGPLILGTRSAGDLETDHYLTPRATQFRIELRLAAATIALWTRVPERWALAAIAFGARAGLFAYQMIVISAVVQVGLALPMAIYFHRLSFTGLSANLLVAPLLEALVPVGFFAVFTGWRFPALIAGWMLRFAGVVADWHARREPAWRVPDPPLALAVAFAAALVLLAVFVRRPRARWPALVAVLALFALLLVHPWAPRAIPGELELTAIDVGQGDSLFVAFPAGPTMVIDGGGLLQFGRQIRRSNLDTGEDVVSPYLWTRGLRRVDIVVATHAHQDHIGGLPAILENFRPAELWTGANPSPALLAIARRLNVRVRELRAPHAFEVGGTRIEILSPPADYDSHSAGNNDSLAFRIRYRDRSFLLTGDMERPMENLLLDHPEEIAADVLKVGHHGSRTSTSQPFLDAVHPMLALISDGFENSFGHPHRDVLSRLNARGTVALRTDLNGLITVHTDGKRLWWEQTAR